MGPAINKTNSNSKSKSKGKALPPTPKTPLPLPDNFSQAQAKRAVEALLAHQAKVSAEREETELIAREEYVYLVVNTKRGSTRRGLMPVRIQLPHPPLPPPPTSSICLITKDPQREYKDLLASPAHNIKFISRVVGVDKLKGKFKPFEARRELMREHDMFLCDDRVLRLMPGLLGKIFFEAKKQPIPVNLCRKDLKAELSRAISSTYFHPTTGTSTSVRIATASESESTSATASSSSSKTLDNLLQAIPSVVAQIPDGWENVLSLGIKTSSSVFLPVWSSKLDGRFESSAKGDDADVEMAQPDVKEKGKKKAVAAETEDVKSSGEAVKKVKAKAVAAVDTPVKAKKALAAGESKSAGKEGKKKSSTLGTGGAGKRAKEAVLGKAR